MPSLGDLSVTLSAVTGKFRRDLDDSVRSLEKSEKSMLRVVGAASKLGVAAGAAGLAVMTWMTKTGLDFVDSQAKVARAIGGTIDGLRGVQIAAKDFGVEQNELTSQMVEFDRKIGEAARGMLEQKRIFDALGLSATALSQMDVDERIATVADRVRELGLSSSQASDVLAKMGINNLKLAGAMREGGDAFRAARREVDDFGLSLSEVDAAKVEAANDAMGRIFRILEGIRNQFVVALAPILGEVAARFNEMVRANGGFAETAQDASQKAIRGFAKVGDVIQGLRVVLKGAELIGVGFGAAMVSVGQIVAEAMTKVIDTITSGVNAAIEQLNKLPKVDIATIDPISNSAFMEGFRSMANELRDKVGEVRGELHEMAMQELPSGKLEEFFEAVQVRAEETAKAVVGAREELGTGLAGFMDEEARKVEEQRQKDLENLKKQLAGRVQLISESLMTETELENARYEQHLADLEAALENEVILREQYNTLTEELEEAHQAALKEIKERNMSEAEKFHAMSWDRQTQTVLGNIAKMTAGVASQNKKMFELNKLAALGQAAVSLPAAVLETFRNNGGWPWGAVAAGFMAASGAAQIQAIRSQTFGGGGGAAPSVAGTTPAPPVSPVSGGAPAGSGGGSRQTISIRGLDPSSIFSGKQVRNLIEAIQSELDDGARLVIT